MRIVVVAIIMSVAISYLIVYPHFIYSGPQSSPTLKQLLKELHSKAADWEDMGIQLDINDGELKQLKSDNRGGSKACLREMLRIWLNRVDPPPSWSAIAEAIEDLGDEQLAQELRSKYSCEEQ